MTRRDLLKTAATLAAGDLPAPVQPPAGVSTPVVTLPGTEPLTTQNDLSKTMMDGAHRFVTRKIAESVNGRSQHWKRDTSSVASYNESVAPNRSRFRTIIGAADRRLPVAVERFGDDDNPALVAESDSYQIHQIRWPVLSDIWGEGLLLQPKQTPKAYVIAIPDADCTPEQLSGLAPGLPPEQQFARRLVENGFEVVVPVLVDRSSEWSGHPEIRMMPDQTHREWIYRQAFLMGRHVIGFEVQKVLAIVDWMERRNPGSKIGVAGYGEGGLIAFYATASDVRIHAALVSGYFDSRQNVWAEPIYRNVWSLLTEFGDAELASLVAPRGLVIEYSAVPNVVNQRGKLTTPPFATVKQEFDRIASLIPATFGQRHLVHGGGDEAIGPWSKNAAEAFARTLDVEGTLTLSSKLLEDRRKSFSPRERQRRQVAGMEDHVQWMVNDSERVRQNFFLYKVMPELADETWTKKLRFDSYPPQRFTSQTAPYRKYLWEEVLGKIDEPPLPVKARTRQIYDREKWAGYDVVLDVWPEVFAWGILLMPKDIKPGERRPVVVCQHGRNSLPRETVEGDVDYYHDFAARLAEQGFITFSPHNLYRNEEGYRWLSRKANGVKASLFSFIIGQHAQILRWLKTLPAVDGNRIAFYGLSYGGETAVRVPTVLEDYALSICSGDFNSWVQKVASTHQRFSFMYTDEWEMPYFNLGNTFDYAEMTYLMIPRPFMVERGHHDQVGRDQWVSYEYAKVRYLYAQLGLSDKTEIEYFNGGHTVNGEGTFRFLHKHLRWPT